MEEANQKMVATTARRAPLAKEQPKNVMSPSSNVHVSERNTSSDNPSNMKHKNCNMANHTNTFRPKAPQDAAMSITHVINPMAAADREKEKESWNHRSKNLIPSELVHPTQLPSPAMPSRKNSDLSSCHTKPTPIRSV
mmetsp:Transcript_30891/g.41236  ORF Transcript_30891/g.41236 Transcript_30891/m.41236 type:complete len:138 (-) Transcript_30891:368-781(-)